MGDAIGKPVWIGESIRRKEDERLLRGLGRFLDDLDDSHAVHVAIGRCPYPHARILGIDAGRALQVPGVARVLAGEQLVARTEPISVLRPFPGAAETPFYGMAHRVARYEGEPVVAVAASDRYIAEDALEHIDVDYEPLPHVVDPEIALASGSPRLYEHIPDNLLVTSKFTAGDADTEFARADAVVKGKFWINRLAGVPIETRALLARYRPDTRVLEVWSSTQSPPLLRAQLAHVLRMSESDIHVSAPDVGGGFGVKLFVYPEDIIVCMLALETGRPVKWVEDRAEHFRTSCHAREAVHELELASTQAGDIVAMRDVYVIDTGAYNAPSGPPVQTDVVLPGPYRLRHWDVERRVALTNKVPMGPYRGYGQPEANFVRETLIDRLARHLGLDPVALRRRNLLTPQELPFQSVSGAVYDSGDYIRCLDMATARAGYAEIRTRQPEWRQQGRHVGVGVSCYVEYTGYPSSAFRDWSPKNSYATYESVTVRVDRSARATIVTGVANFGQGSETTLAQVCASELRLDPAAIAVQHDSLGAYSLTGFASRTMIASAGAIRTAAGQIRGKILRIAAHLLGVPSTTLLEIAGGVVRARHDFSLQIPLPSVCEAAFVGAPLPDGEEPGLEVIARFATPSAAFGYGTAVAQVQVDARTGEFEIQRYLLVHDCGTQVNPMVVEGQIHGGIAQGLGGAMFEELRYDPETGQMVNGSMLEYLVPTAADLPRFEVDHLEIPSPVSVFGIKGVGEAGTIAAAAAVTNAINDALVPFGVEIHRLPITAESVWTALASTAETVRTDGRAEPPAAGDR